jgi:hypothetical protein
MKKNQKLIREDLHKDLIKFYRACIEYKEKQEISKELEGIIGDHYKKVTQIISDFRLNEIEASANKGRPKNQIARDYFEEKVTSFQYENRTDKFPIKEDFLDKLQEDNIKRSEEGLEEIVLGDRTYDDYVQEWKEGFFNLNS